MIDRKIQPDEISIIQKNQLGDVVIVDIHSGNVTTLINKNDDDSEIEEYKNIESSTFNKIYIGGQNKYNSEDRNN